MPVKTGIANNSSIELVESTLKEGDEVIIEQIGGDTQEKGGERFADGAAVSR